MMRPLLALGLAGSVSAQLSTVTPMLEAANCGVSLVVGATISGRTADQCHTDANQHGECQITITDSAGNPLNDGDSFAPGSTVTVSMVSECMGMAADGVSGAGRGGGRGNRDGAETDCKFQQRLA